MTESVLKASCAIMCWTAAALSFGAPDEPAVTLRSLAARRDFSIGAAVGPGQITSETSYSETLAREFNMVTTENALKFGPVHPQPDRYDFSGADTIVDYATSQGMKVRGHCLVWHDMQPAWLTRTTWTQERISEVLREHIHKVAGRYKGRIAAWDVVNEAIGDGEPVMRETFWLGSIGPEYIANAFRWAHEADPEALLFYNDFGGEGMNRKSDRIYSLVKKLKDSGVPIHGVGLQMHIGIKHHPRPGELRANMRRLAELGLQVHITELDVKIQETTASLEVRLQQQAQIYRDVTAACLDTPGCTAMVLWGFTDKHSWIPWATKRDDAALIFDKQYEPKPAYYAILEELQKGR